MDNSWSLADHRRRFGSSGSEVQLGLAPKRPSVVSRLGGDINDGGDGDQRGVRHVERLRFHGLQPVEPLHFELLHRSHADDVASQLVVNVLQHHIRGPDQHVVRRL